MIINNIKVISNGHVLITHLAISDILVCCMVPLTTVTAVTRLSSSNAGFWNYPVCY